MIAVVTWQNAGKLGKAEEPHREAARGPRNPALPPGDRARRRRNLRAGARRGEAGPRRLRRASGSLRARRAARDGAADGGEAARQRLAGGRRIGDFEAAFAAATVKIDEVYTTPDQSHAMMEPHATIAAWEGDELTVWTSNQMVAWAVRDLAETLRIRRKRSASSRPTSAVGSARSSGSAATRCWRRSARARQDGRSRSR